MGGRQWTLAYPGDLPVDNALFANAVQLKENVRWDNEDSRLVDEGWSFVEPVKYTDVRVVSRSAEAFYDVQAELLVSEDEEVPIPRPYSELAPGEEVTWAVYFRHAQGSPGGPFPVRVRFKDADGRQWERRSDGPLVRIAQERNEAKSISLTHQPSRPG